MSLKELIRALFKLSGGQAMPKSQWTDLDLQAQQFQMPYDGWLKFGFLTTGTESPWYFVSIQNGLSSNVVASNFISGGSQGFIPVKKGDTVRINVNNCSLSQLQVFNLVGGGGFLRFIKQLVLSFKEVQYA